MWLIPSRLRPHRLNKLILACLENEISTPALVLLDEDDPTLTQYRELALPPNWIIRMGTGAGLSKIYNGAYWTHPNEPWYGILCDDVVPETKNFDMILIKAAGTDGLAFGDDGINGSAHATHFVLGGDFVRDRGWLTLPGLDRIYIDTVWNDIAHYYKVYRYLPDVKLTHHHFSNGKALVDATYRKHEKARDKEIYETWKIEELKNG